MKPNFNCGYSPKPNLQHIPNSWGRLDADASRRLRVAIKGTIQQYFEARDEAAEAMFRKVEQMLRGLVETGEMTSEDVAEELNDMRKDLGNEGGAIRSELPHADITIHPLYQQTIKDVLSEEAFAQYTARQAERENLYQQALRNVAGCKLGYAADFGRYAAKTVRNDSSRTDR